MNFIKPITGVILLSQLVPAAIANDSDQEEIEQIVVTGTRTAKLLSDSPVKVDVISGETIAQLSQSTLAQALNFYTWCRCNTQPKRWLQHPNARLRQPTRFSVS